MQIEWTAAGEKWEPWGGEPGDAAGLTGQLLGLTGPELCL